MLTVGHLFMYVYVYVSLFIGLNIDKSKQGRNYPRLKVATPVQKIIIVREFCATLSPETSGSLPENTKQQSAPDCPLSG